MHRLLRSRRLALLASGGVALGLSTAFDQVNFAEIFAAFLSQLFSALVSLLVGGLLGDPGAAV